MKVLVGINTYNCCLGDPLDHAVIEISDKIRDSVRKFVVLLNEHGVDFIQKFDESPEFRFVHMDVDVDTVRMVVDTDGDFWWEGFLKNTHVSWETGRIPSALLDQPDSSDYDLRENKGCSCGDEYGDDKRCMRNQI